jgi:aspartyl-tRNA(Asn)/glutamyl-tRNA(Gln) amidotransferase subunit A
MDDVLDGDLRRAARLLAKGEISSAALTQAAIARIDASPAARACFLRFEPDVALAAARAADEERDGARPLNGVPLAHKDLFARAGRTISCATHPQLQQTGASTADVLQMLDAAGALDLGGLHLSEFAMGPAGWSEQYGFLHNPRDPGLVTGGSSSGSAAAVGYRLVFAALGTDTGGSIRIPAAFCGVVGFKPTVGRVPTRGCFPVSESLDTTGPLARTVSDCAMLFDTLAGTKTCAEIDASQKRALRYGVLSLASLPVAPDAAVVTAHENALVKLRAAGLDLHEVTIDNYAELNALCGMVFLTEGAAVHATRLQAQRDFMGPQVVERLLQGLAFPGALYLRAKQARREHLARLRETVFASVDVMLLPVSPGLPPSRATYEMLGDTGAILDFNSRVGAYTPAFSYLGIPVVSLPFPHQAAGIGGYGFQIVADFGEDATALQAAAVIERARDA